MTYATTSRTLLTICSFFFALAAYAQTTLVETNSIFDYYDNGDQPANDASGNVWYSADYDATWDSFAGPLGYGAGDHNDILDASANTVYFRHQWTIESTLDFDLMFFNLLYNDGAIIYLNGVMLNRTNMPVGIADYNTNASSNVEDQQMRNLAFPHLFIDGINTIAVEVHNSADAGDTNLSFGIEVIEYHEVCETVGQACNDMDSNTINDTINEECECEGFACDITADAGETQEINEGQSATLEAQGGGTYFWSTGASTSSIVVSPTSTTGYSVTVTDENGCEDFDDVMVNVIACNAVADAGLDVVLNLNENTVLTANESSAYAWNTGETTRSINVSPSSDETYTVTITDENGCHAEDDVLVMVNICVVGSPCDDNNAFTHSDQINEFCECAGTPCNITVAITGDDSIELGESVTLTASGGTSFTWNNGMSTASITVSPLTTTNYSVVVADENGCGDAASFSVEVIEVTCTVGEPCNDNSDGTYGDQLNADCECEGFPCQMDVEIGGDTEISMGESATIVAEGGINYIWDNGAIGPVLEVSPTETTTYFVTIIADNGCEDFGSFTVEVPACIVGGPCDDNSDGTYGDQLNADCECEGFPCQMDVEITGDTEISMGESATIVAEGGINYIWDHGAIGPILTVSPTETTTYFVTIIADNGCEDFGSFTVEVAACTIGEACDDNNDDTYDDQLNANCECEGFPCHMDIEIAGDNIIAPGESATIVVEGGITYIWDNGAVGPVQTFSPSATTTYNVTIIGNNGCEEFASFTVVVDGCSQGAPCDDGIATTYGDAIDEDCNCTGFDCVMDIEITGETEILLGDSTTLVAEGGVSYTWNNGMTGPVIVVSPTSTTNYSVVVEDANGCGGTGSILVSIINCGEGNACNDGNAETHSDTINSDCNCEGIACDMDVVVSGDTNIQSGETSALTAAGGVGYVWSHGDVGANISVSPVATTTYTVVVTDFFGCEDEGQITVVVAGCNVQAEVPSFYSMFLGNDQVLTAAGGQYYEWSTGETTADITVSPTDITIYEVTVFNSPTCFETVEITVEVIEDLCLLGDPCNDLNPLTTNDAIDENCECVGEEVVCDVQPEVPNFYSMFLGDDQVLTAAGGQFYEWSTGETTASITVSPTDNTTYDVTVFNSASCFEIVEISIEVIEDLCRLGDPCDDLDPLTTNDAIDENCECVGSIAGGTDTGSGSKTEGTESASTETSETEGKDQEDTPDYGDEDCTPITSFFSTNRLKHYGNGSAVTQYEFANLQAGVSFTISGITAKLSSTDKRNYIDVVDVSYVNESGQEVSYGTFSGENVKEVEVNISENIQKVIISLVDGYDGYAPKINISLGNISSCSIDRKGAQAYSTGLQAQQELIAVSLQSNLVNGRLMLNIDNPNSSPQPIYAVVVDVNGVNVIPDAVSGSVLPGAQSEYIDITSLKPGLYYLKTKVGRQTITLKFVVAE